ALIQAAQAVAGQFGLSKARLTAGRVGAALRTISGELIRAFAWTWLVALATAPSTLPLSKCLNIEKPKSN
ncbi:MAG TPA: hypothetical protein VIT23_12815, partial [Terrimicrobiaceae bacterium]